MSIATNAFTASQTSLNHRIARKPPPPVEYWPRYPEFDPSDPFAPLWVLRSRTASNLTALGDPPRTPTSLYGEKHFFSDEVFARPSTFEARRRYRPGTADSSNTEFSSLTDRELPVSGYQHSQFRPPSHYQNRRRSQSIHIPFPSHESNSPPVNKSPYGHRDLHSYILATSSPLAMSDLSDSSNVSSFASSHDYNEPSRDLPPSLKIPENREVLVPSTTKPASKLTRFFMPAKTRTISAPMHSGYSSDRPRKAPPVVASMRPRPSRHAAESEPESRPRNAPIKHRQRQQSLISSPPTKSEIVSELGYSSQPERDSAAARIVSHGRKPLPARPQTTSSTREDHAHIHAHPGAPSRPTIMQKKPPLSFEENALPTTKQLSDAARLLVIAESGVRVPFGDLWLGRKTVVCFIRHFWCPLCQDYMSSIAHNVDPLLLQEKDVNLIIISNGSHNMIKSYRQIFRMPFALYTDPTLQVYAALGMTLRTLDAGSESRRGAYVRHGLMSGIAMVVANALRVGMPVWERGGDIAQLGGEFVLGPGLNCTYAHRMRTTRSHTPILRVLAAAGVDTYVRLEPRGSGESTARSEADEANWMEARRRSLEKLRQRKKARRAGEGACGEGACEIDSRRTSSSGSSIHADDGIDDVIVMHPRGRESVVIIEEEEDEEENEDGRRAKEAGEQDLAEGEEAETANEVSDESEDESETVLERPSGEETTPTSVENSDEWEKIVKESDYFSTAI